MIARKVLALAVASLIGACSAQAATSDSSSSVANVVPAHYQRRELAGFTVYINDAVVAHADVFAAIIRGLDAQLTDVRFYFGAHIARVEDVRIWVEWSPSPNGVAKGDAEYHRSRQWLVEHGFDPAKEHGIEINDVRKYLQASATYQPAALLHEFAHAYRDLALGDKLPMIARAYDQAFASGRYDSVQRVGGERTRAYAMMDAEEYFAELTEAYLAVNDFFPFVHEHVASIDLAGATLMREVWGPPVGRATLSPVACASPSVSNAAGALTAVEVVNSTARPLRVDWIDSNGERRSRGTLAPGESTVHITFVGHAFTMSTDDGACVANFVAPVKPSKLLVTGTGG